MTNTQAEYVKAFSEIDDLAEVAELDHAEAHLVNEKLTQIGRLERHASMEARATAYEIRDELLAAGFRAQAIGDVPAELCAHGIAAGRKCSICIEDAATEKCLLEHGYVKPCQQDRGHAGECDKETVGLVRKTGIPQAPRVSIHTAGELHAAPEMPVPDFVFNLSRLLDDPAHKPDAELIELDGLDSRVQDFVFATDGAWDLYAAAVRMIERQIVQGKSVTALVLCRGGKHRSVAFGDWLAAHFSVEATHHHKHLPRVIGAKKYRDPKLDVQS